MAHFNKGSHSFTFHPHVYSQNRKWNELHCAFTPRLAAEHHHTLPGTHVTYFRLSVNHSLEIDFTSK